MQRCLKEGFACCCFASCTLHSAVLPARHSTPSQIAYEAPDACLRVLTVPLAVAGAPPAAAVGRWVRLWWPDDEEWYEAEVREYRPADGQHRVWYPEDEQVCVCGVCVMRWRR